MSNGASLSHPCRAQGPSWKRRQRGLERNWLLSIRVPLPSWTHSLLSRAWAKSRHQYFIVQWGGALETPPLTEEPLTVDRCWGSKFSIRVWLLVGWPVDNSMPLSTQSAQLNGLLLLFKKKKKDTTLGGDGKAGMDLGGVREDEREVNVIKTYFIYMHAYKISKE